MTQNTLFVCVLCRFSETDSKHAKSNPGQTLFNRLNQGITALNHQDTITLQPVRCMGACSHACVVAFAAPNKLTFILSGLSSTDSVADLLKFSAQYMACSDGKVPFKERPDTVKQKIHAVLPSLPAKSSYPLSGTDHA